MACQRLYSEKIVRPGLTTLERMVIQARQEAQEETLYSQHTYEKSATEAEIGKMARRQDGKTAIFI